MVNYPRSVWVAFLIFGAACAVRSSTAVPPVSSAPHAASPQTHIMAEADDGKAVHLARGDVLLVRLSVRSGTGYEWTVVSSPSSLRVDGPTENNGQAPFGAEEPQQFRFEARAAGSGAIVLELRRPWEKGAPALRTVRFTLTVD
jgi:predicted secreted protein